MCQQYLLFAERMALCPQSGNCVYVAYKGFLINTTRRQIFIAEQQSGYDTPKTNFRLLTRLGPEIPLSNNVIYLPFYTSLLLPLSSPVDFQQIVVPLFQFSDRVAWFHNVLPLGESRGGRSSGPGQVRRELITFQCCFSTLCKEQSELISIDYRRMLIQCHADRLQTLQRRMRAALAFTLSPGFLQQTQVIWRLLALYCLSNLWSTFLIYI